MASGFLLKPTPIKALQPSVAANLTEAGPVQNGQVGNHFKPRVTYWRNSNIFGLWSGVGKLADFFVAKCLWLCNKKIISQICGHPALGEQLTHWFPSSQTWPDSRKFKSQLLSCFSQDLVASSAGLGIIAGDFFCDTTKKGKKDNFRMSWTST